MTIKLSPKPVYRIGVIADTHGRLPRSVLGLFKDLELIIHAGDIGEPAILSALEEIAPTVAVRGNMDMGKWTRQLPEEEIIEIGSILLYVRHDVYRLKFDLDSSRYQAVINGHTHCARIDRKNGILFINPGSAALPRFGQPATVAVLRVDMQTIQARIHQLSRGVN